MLRMPRLAQLLNVEKVKGFINTYYSKQLQSNIRKGNDENYPTMKIMYMVQIYKILLIVLVIFSCSYFLGLMWLIVCKDIYPWEEHTGIDVYKGTDTFYTYEGYGF